MVLERNYQASLIKTLETIFPGCVILKNDAGYRLGFPDILILFNDRWAALEVKRTENAPHQANQDYWIDTLDNMSFATFIYPENEEAVLHDLQQALYSRR